MLVRGANIDKSIARIALFDMFLKDRPVDKDIESSILVSATQNFVASDIEAIVNQAARTALQLNCDITLRILIDTINTISPSITNEMIGRFKRFKSGLSI